MAFCTELSGEGVFLRLRIFYDAFVLILVFWLGCTSQTIFAGTIENVALEVVTPGTALMADPNTPISQLSKFSKSSQDFILPMQGGKGMAVMHGTAVGFSLVMGAANSMNLMFVNDDSGPGKYFAMGGTSFLTAFNCYSLVRDLALFCRVPEQVLDVDTEKYRRLLAPALGNMIYSEGIHKLGSARVWFLPVAVVASIFYALPDARSSGRAIESFSENFRNSSIESFSENFRNSSDASSAADESVGATPWYWFGFTLNFLSTGTMIFVTLLDIADDVIDSAKSIPGFFTLGYFQFKEIPKLEFLEGAGGLLYEKFRRAPYANLNSALNINDKGVESLSKLVHQKNSILGETLNNYLSDGGYVVATVNLPDVATLAMYTAGAILISSALSYTFTAHQSNDFAQTLGFYFDESRHKVVFNGTDVMGEDGTDICAQNPECVSARDQLADRKFWNWVGYLVQGIVIANAAVHTVKEGGMALFAFYQDVWHPARRGKAFLVYSVLSFGISALGQYGYLAHTTGQASVEAIRKSQTFDEQLRISEYSEYDAETIGWMARVALGFMFIPGATRLFTGIFLWLHHRILPTGAP